MLSTITLKYEFILASSSPRRRELLAAGGIAFRSLAPEVDESALDHETPAEMVCRLARAKAQVIAKNFPNALVLGADTVVVCSGKILGKPGSDLEACAMLRCLQGREHSVWGGIALLRESGKIDVSEAHETRVSIAALTEAEILSYVATGEPLDKAGSYAAQGKGAQFVESVKGSYSNVVGLNLAAVNRLLKTYAV